MASQVKGLDRLNRQLAALAPAVAAAMAQELAMDAADLAEKIKAAAPRSNLNHPHMADGIKASVVTGDAGDATGRDEAKGAHGLAWKVSAPFPARFVEFGTKAAPAGRYRDAKGKTRTNKRAHHATERHPFFWPTVRAWKKLFHGRLVRAGSKAAKQAAAA